METEKQTFFSKFKTFYIKFSHIQSFTNQHLKVNESIKITPN